MNPLHSDTGFTLVELLVVVMIVSVLALVAIPTFTGVRDRAFRAAVEADLRNGAVAMVTYLTSEGGYPTATEVTLAASPLVTVSIALPTVAGDTTGFCLRGVHDRLGAAPVASYDSRTSGLTDGDAC